MVLPVSGTAAAIHLQVFFKVLKLAPITSPETLEANLILDHKTGLVKVIKELGHPPKYVRNQKSNQFPPLFPHLHTQSRHHKSNLHFLLLQKTGM